MRRASLLMLAASVLLLAAPALAATPEALAAKQVADAEKAARITFRSALLAAQLQVNGALDGVALTLPAATSPSLLVDELFTALDAFQVDVFAAQNLASVAQAEAVQEALGTLGTKLHGIYPVAFHPGDGTARSRFEQALEKDLAKVYAKLEKRLTKLAARFAAEDFSLHFRIAPPATNARAWNETEVDFLTVFAPTIDLALSVSDLAILGDGQVRVAGCGSALPPSLFVVAGFAEPDGLQTDQVTPAGNRYTGDFEGAAFVEGVWLLTVQQDALPGPTTSLGVR